MNRLGPKPRPFECREDLFWYLVGLIATDGSLSVDGRHVDITSSNAEHLEQIRVALGLRCRVRPKRSGYGSLGFHLQIGSVGLHQKLRNIGLTPRKSLTIGPLTVPDQYFKDFLRGVIDGDGGIRRWIHPANGREQWVIRIVGASKPFLAWIEGIVERLWQVHGAMHVQVRKAPHRPLYTLKYGKLAAKVILTECYHPGALALEQKRTLAAHCVAVPVGWSQSETVDDTDRWRTWKYVHTWSNKLAPLVQDTDGRRPGFNEQFIFTCDTPGWLNLAEAAGLKLAGRKAMWVRIPPPADLRGLGKDSERMSWAVSSAG